MRVPFAFALTILMLAVALHPTTTAADEAVPTGSPPEAVDYGRDIAPIFEVYCVACHTADDANGEFVLDSFADLLGGGEHGPAITPGEPDSSRLFLMVAGRIEPVMPPDDMEGPNEAERALLRLWIEQGAKGPEGDPPVRRMPRTPQIERTSNQPLPITAVALAPQQPHLAVARFRSVEIVEVGSEKTLRTLPEQPGKVNDLRFSSDGRRLVVASGVTGAFGQASVYEVASGERIAELVGHRDILYAAALSPDGKTVATAGYDAEVRLWDLASGELLQTLSGHNGAIFDVAFSPDGAVLATASADETVKLWKVSSGERLDTLAQPQGEVWSVAFTPDGERIVAGSADNQFRVWKFVSRERARTNPLVATRFADEAPLVRLTLTADGQRLIVASAAGRLTMFDTASWSQVSDLPDGSDLISDIAVNPAGDRAVVGSMDGTLSWIDLPSGPEAMAAQGTRFADSPQPIEEIYLTVEALAELQEPTGGENQRSEQAMPLPRGAIVQGVLQAGDGDTAAVDWFRFDARRGEVWMIETQAARDGSPLDSVVQVFDAASQPVLRTRLQAVHESYFTFRGKDSTQSNDFRLFDWQAMELNDYLYSAGEVTRLWMYPRGPDSGFNVYPGTGARWTFFDTTPVTHALQEPAYIVRELAPGESPASNGLPVFEIPYLNDDDGSRQIGSDSRLRFVAPSDGSYKIAVRDARGLGGADFKYRLTLRPASPDYRPRVDKITQPIPAGAGREFRVAIVRSDDYPGPVEFEISGLPEGLHATEHVVIEAGQNEAFGVVWADADVPANQTFAPPRVVARAKILGRVVERAAGDLGELKTGPRPQATLRIVPDIDASSSAGDPDDASATEAVAASETATLRIRPGETISAVVHVDRHGNEGEIRLGNEFAGRNMPHGVFVDNIGLSGLLVLPGSDRQQFFITAAPTAALGPRLFHLTAAIEGGITSPPVLLEVVEE
ncbi:c-type cytochrome domain-containing protein [Candidatus Laterigemmans baculatus]|uniref:c-type cytochrome domain-containing protein n=1 Tax=Candidatus Laterigemmans baculatus TaxID=2770505 RepID=UPI0013DBCD7B|nr:c-type cytochrome domain-containing protein [Candidatus Laterigemmans baculatus]